MVTESSPDIVKRALYELLQKGLKGVFRRDAVATALGEATLLHPEMPSVVVDVLALVDTETTTMGGSTKEERDRCGHLIIFFLFATLCCITFREKVKNIIAFGKSIALFSSF